MLSSDLISLKEHHSEDVKAEADRGIIVPGHSLLARGALPSQPNEGCGIALSVQPRPGTEGLGVNGKDPAEDMSSL